MTRQVETLTRELHRLTIEIHARVASARNGQAPAIASATPK
jgi:hypothetical protein